LEFLQGYSFSRQNKSASIQQPDLSGSGRPEQFFGDFTLIDQFVSPLDKFFHLAVPGWFFINHTGPLKNDKIPGTGGRKNFAFLLGTGRKDPLS
jgi:hypothetical protein